MNFTTTLWEGWLWTELSFGNVSDLMDPQDFQRTFCSELQRCSPLDVDVIVIGCDNTDRNDIKPVLLSRTLIVTGCLIRTLLVCTSTFLWSVVPNEYRGAELPDGWLLGLSSFAVSLMKSEEIPGKAGKKSPGEQGSDRVAVIAPAASSWMQTYPAHPVQSTSCYFKSGNDKSGEERSCNIRERCRILVILVWGLPICLCCKWWEPVPLRAGNNSGTDHTFRGISDNLWEGRTGNGKEVSLDFEKDIDLENLYSFFRSKVKWKANNE